ncbi:MAG TPA: class I SAM-dependent methyltransferase [Candidatus Saccharimonadales bacterium]|nr:class I SAM-dependent methyltransferase [Candidatus Saccharimonadales bacterium]
MANSGLNLLWEEAISHPHYGDYTQRVYEDVEDAGHLPLATGGTYGWGMPNDPPTAEFVGDAAGKVLMDVGTGLGHATVLPALENGAAAVYATDVSEGNFADMRQRAEAMGCGDALHKQLLDAGWWDRPLSKRPTVATVLGALATADLPADGSVDLLVARHSLQFGDPSTVLRFFDLAAAALKPGGQAMAINFTPFTHYMHQFDNGRTMRRIADLNWDYAAGDSDLPGGYLHPTEGYMHHSLAELMGKAELATGQDYRFLFFDEHTVVGLLRDWVRSRQERGLDAPLVIAGRNFFAPSSIAKVNKLVEDDAHANKENFVFTLQKQS